MTISICVHTYIHTIHTQYTHTHTCTHTIHIHVHTQYTYMYMCTHNTHTIHTYTHVHTQYTYMYTHTHVHIHMYTNTYTHNTYVQEEIFPAADSLPQKIVIDIGATGRTVVIFNSLPHSRHQVVLLRVNSHKVLVTIVHHIP